MGDPEQLPPTLLSHAARAARLGQSLFERLRAVHCHVTLLQQQYRMHPSISAFPSTHFYQAKLQVRSGGGGASFTRISCRCGTGGGGIFYQAKMQVRGGEASFTRLSWQVGGGGTFYQAKLQVRGRGGGHLLPG